MDEKPRFEIVEQIGHGQFSIVYKARWINGPLMPECATSELTQNNYNFLQQQQALNNTLAAQQQDCHQQQTNVPNKQILKSPLDSNNQQQPTFLNNNTRQHHQQLVLNSNNQTTKGRAAVVSTDKYVALKRIKFYDIQNSKMRMDYVKEVRLLQQLKHPNIINYNISFIERNELFIVLELADGGDLSKLIRYFHKRKQLLSERTILKYFTQVCSAVRYIHSKRILHRDIKPANIFMTSDGCVKLGDFGLGRFFSQNTRDAHTIVGTFYYMSPERIRESGYGFSSDIWSLGCVLYELITLSSPFSILNLEQQKHQQITRQQQQLQQQQSIVAEQRSKKQLTINQNHHSHQQTPIHSLNQHHHNQTLEEHPPIIIEQQQQPQPQHNPYNLQWLIDRILRADYPSLDAYTGISPTLRRLATECLNPNPDSRPHMDIICSVVNEVYYPQQAQ